MIFRLEINCDVYKGDPRDMSTWVRKTGHALLESAFPTCGTDQNNSTIPPIIIAHAKYYDDLTYESSENG